MRLTTLFKTVSITFLLSTPNGWAKTTEQCAEELDLVNKREVANTRFENGQLGNPENLETFRHQIQETYRCTDLIFIDGEDIQPTPSAVDVCLIRFKFHRNRGVFRPKWVENEAIYFNDSVTGLSSIDSFYDPYQPVYFDSEENIFRRDFEKVKEAPLEYMSTQFDPESEVLTSSLYQAKLFGKDKLLKSFQAQCIKL